MKNSQKMNVAEFKNRITTLNTIHKKNAFLKICVIAKKYLNQHDIKEISAFEFSEVSGLSPEESQKVLIKLNSDLFNS